MRDLTILLSLLLLLGCGTPTGVLGADDDDGPDDDDATDDDDDATDDDDDDIVPGDDDDATPPKNLLDGFLMYDPETEAGPNGNGPAAAYALLPLGSIDSCDGFLENFGYDSDDDFIGLYFISGQAAEWEGDYVEFYGDCRAQQPDAQCFSAWGKSPDSDFWETGENDTLTITAWGDVIYGVLHVGAREIAFGASNCGEIDFDEEYDGEHAGERTEDAPAPPTQEQGNGRSSWKLRFR